MSTDNPPSTPPDLGLNTTAPPTGGTPPAAPPPTEPPDDTDWRAEARKWEQRAKDNRTAAQALERQQRATMTDAERQVAQARQEGRTEAITLYGTRLVRTEFDALAGRRNPGFDTRGALEYMDLGKFLGDDGEPDTRAIKQAVERLVPAPADGPASFDGGPRTTPPKPTSMNDILRRTVGRE